MSVTTALKPASQQTPSVTPHIRKDDVTPDREGGAEYSAISSDEIGPHTRVIATALAESSFVGSVEAFNRKIKVLTLDMHNRFRTDSMVWRAKERVMSAIAIDPLYIIDVVGAYLFAYRAQIYERESAFFVEQDYEREFRESRDSSKVDAVKYIMPKIKSAWKTLDASTRKQYEDCVIGMLDDYVEYLFLKKSALR